MAGAKFAGTNTEMVGFQVAVLIPALVALTIGATPVRFGAETAVAVTAPDAVIVPAA